jgi:GTPase SAR1 family protein
MEVTKRILVLGESKVGKTWLLKQLFADQTAEASNAAYDDDPDDDGLQDGKLQSELGCHLHVHLVNEHLPQLVQFQQGKYFFSEFYEIGGSVSQSELTAYTYQMRFDALVVVFDLSNAKSLASLTNFVTRGL